MSKKRKVGRPKGTTRANGYKVSPGRPRNEDRFMRRIIKGFKKLLSPPPKR
jgi:hypothetical protein|tara:strand:+ start:2972 stop:3124 length:153 start_codon:yes stop_codon:yes gene_type:complete